MSALSAVLLVFSSGLVFFHVGLPGCTVGRTAAYWFTWRTAQGNDFELILAVKMETRYPAEGYGGCEFQAICNHCRVMAA